MPEEEMPEPDKELRAEETVIAGRNPVLEALQEGSADLDRIYLQQGAKGPWVDRLRQDARGRGVSVHFVPKARLSRLAGKARHQGVVAVAAQVAYLVLEEMLNAVAANPGVVRAEQPVLVMLDRIEDPRNYGAILRTAAAAGVQGVIVPERHMAPLSPAAVKASAGAALRVPIARTRSLTDAVQQLKERGYWIVGTAGDGETVFWEMDWDRPVVVVIGSEAKGLRSTVREVCDFVARIPMAGPVESLNAGVAAGVVLFDVLRGRFDAAQRRGEV